MKRLLLILFLTVRALAISNSGCDAETGSTVASQACTLNASTAANHIQLIFLSYPTATTTTLTDSFSLSYTSWVTQTLASTPNYTAEIRCGFTASNSGTETITAHYSPSSSFVYLGAMERTDVTYGSCAQALDTFGAGLGIGKGSGTGTTLTSGNATTTNGNDVAVGFGVTDGAANTLALGAGYSSVTAVPGGVSNAALPEQKTVVSANTSTNATETDGTSGHWGIVMVLICPGNCVSPSKGFAAVY